MSITTILKCKNNVRTIIDIINTLIIFVVSFSFKFIECPLSKNSKGDTKMRKFLLMYLLHHPMKTTCDWMLMRLCQIHKLKQNAFAIRIDKELCA